MSPSNEKISDLEGKSRKKKSGISFDKAAEKYQNKNTKEFSLKHSQ
jgi:hypothetical protein